MRYLPALLGVLAIAACGESAPTNDAPAPSPTQPSQPGPSPDPAPKPTPEPEQPHGVPAAFHGVWAATTADCDAPAETRLEISADRLRFYESSGPASAVKVVSPTEIVVTVALTGEGALSQRSFRYRLLDDGAKLFDVRNGLTRMRCPA